MVEPVGDGDGGVQVRDSVLDEDFDAERVEENVRVRVPVAVSAEVKVGEDAVIVPPEGVAVGESLGEKTGESVYETEGLAVKEVHVPAETVSLTVDDTLVETVAVVVYAVLRVLVTDAVLRERVHEIPVWEYVFVGAGVAVLVNVGSVLCEMDAVRDTGL